MYKFPIGIMVDSLNNLDTASAIKKAAELGAQGIQMYSTTGENSPENLTGQKRRELLNLVKDNGLVFSAICGDLGMGFTDKKKNPKLIEKSKIIMELAKELECDVVTTHIGVVPSDPNHDRFKIMQEACFELSRYADSLGSHFAIETGPETSLTLKNFLDSLNSKGVAVNLDPANLVMVTGDDPVQAVYNLKDYIVHTHAKDGVMLQKSNPEYIYKSVHPVPEEYFGVKYFEEVPLGTGKVDFKNYLKALEDIGYKGYLTIEREVGANPEADIKTAVEFLQRTIENN
ncbi:MAG: sugar phosphate isomerase/epimerase family protein [Clostridia bacterium]|nr:sugar phosphate isomerase/epimerase family protein [Clostridia bacterium]